MAGKKNEASIKFRADTSQFNDEIKAADSSLACLRGELKLNQAQMKNTGTTVEGLTKSKQLLEEQDATLSQKVISLNGKLEAAERIWGENSTEAQRYVNQINAVKTVQEGIRGQIDRTSSALDEQTRAQGKSESEYEKLSSTITEQKARVSSLEREYANAVLTYGKNSSEVKELETHLSQANTELRSSENKMDAANNAARDLSHGLDEASDGAADMKNSVGELVAGNVIADFAQEAVSSLTGLVDATEENRVNMNKLQNSFEWSGRSMDDATQVYRNFLGLCGDSDQATEAALDMNNLADAGADIDTWYDIASGAVSAFGDALPVENLIESANEAIRTGQVTGGLADALNWTSINADLLNNKLGSDHPEAMAAFNSALGEGASTEDAMNDALAACSTEQERQQILTTVLASQYSELGVSYQDLNSDIIDSRTANDELLQAQSDLAEQVAPLQSAVTSLAADGIQFLSNNLSWIVPVVAGAGVAFGVLSVAMNFGSIVEGLSVAMGVLNAVMALNPVVLVVAAIALLIGIFVALWNNCEEFRNFWIGLWDDVCTKAGEVWGWIDTNLVQPIQTGFQSFCDFIGLLFSDPFAALRLAALSVLGWLDSTFPGLSSTVSGVISGMQAFFADPFGALRNAAQGILSWVSSSFPGLGSTVSSVITGFQAFFSDPFGALRNAVNGIINWWKSNFKLPKIEFPHFSIPHFSISGSWNPVDWFNGNWPRVDVAWYAKGAVFNRPTIFGYSNGKAHIGGEAGPEAISPISTLQSYIRDAVDSGSESEMLARIERAIDKLDAGLGSKIAENAPQFPNGREFSRLTRKALQ